MLIRFDITYLQSLAYCKEFPCAPATLFQGIVAANAYRLDEIADLLEVLEKGKCVRIVNVEPTARTRVNPAVPRLPKLSEIRGAYAEGKHYSNLIKDEVIFVLEPADVHVSYYFETQDMPVDRLHSLSLHTLGRGRSRCISSVTVVGTLPEQRSTDKAKVWEPVTNGRCRMDIPYDGFLSNLRLYHSLKKSSSEVHKEKQAFSTSKSKHRYTMFKLYGRDDETFSFPAERTAELAGMLRHAVIEKMKTPELKEYASGRGSTYVQYLPLPTLGKYTDNRIRRALIVEQSEGLQLPAVQVSELKLIDHAGNHVATAKRVLKSDSVFDMYLSEGKKWISVTPAVLPGHDDNDQRKRQRLITKMFSHAGLPIPSSITELPVNGKFQVNTKHGHDKYPRTMCMVEFAEDVEGTVALGTGRNYGLGIFANLSNSVTA